MSRAALYIGDVRDVLRSLPGGSVQTCVTSPPYWGLRDYKVVGQLGLEASPAEYITNMVEVFEGVRRVLRDDGTLWLNIGDSYAQQGGPGWQGKNGQRADRRFTAVRDSVPMRAVNRTAPFGLKPKDLVMMPARLAIALQAAGWWVRSDIIWSKPNPMPESVTDRPTKAHEYIFLLSKSERYYYDADAICEPVSPNTHARISQDVANQVGSARANGGTRADRPMKAVVRDAGVTAKNNPSMAAAICLPVTQRNARSVWPIVTQSYRGAHFATFPEALPRRCILAGSRPGDTVLDPFGGSGTTAKVATDLGRAAIHIELNPAYLPLAQDRIGPMLCDVVESGGGGITPCS